MFLKHEPLNTNKINVVVPTGFEPVFKPWPWFRQKYHHVREVGQSREQAGLKHEGD